MAQRFVCAGATLLGFVGRDEARTRAAVGAVGCGEVLSWAALVEAEYVVFAVGDNQLADAVRSAAAVGGPRAGLWLHTSGRHGLDVFEAAASLGVQFGSLHPLAPFPASVSIEHVPGGPAVLQGDASSLASLRALCSMLEFEPIVCGEQDRALYHAACALAANGATALFGLAAQVLRGAGGLAEQDAQMMVSSLMTAAVDAAGRHGAGPALSGPVRRGDCATVSAHLERLQSRAPEGVASYRALMSHAAQLAAEEGLPPDVSRRLHMILLGHGGPLDGSGGGD